MHGKRTYLQQPCHISESGVGTSLVYIRGSHLGVILPRHIWQSLKVFLVIAARTVLLASSREITGCSTSSMHPLHGIIWPNVSQGRGWDLALGVVSTTTHPKGRSNMGHRSFSLVRTPGVVSWLKVGLMLFVRWNAIKESVCLPLQTQPGQESTTRKRSCSHLRKANLWIFM